MSQYDIEIRNTNVASDLPDCVIVLDFSRASADCQAWMYANAKSDGTDIRVYLSDGVTQLNHDLISFSKPGTDQVAGYMRILVPNVDSSANTPLRLDCDGARSDGSTTSTYPSAWRGYWTLDQDPSGSAPQMIDRTSNANHGTTQGSMTSGQSIAGQLGNSLNCDGSNDRVSCGTDTSLAFTGSVCVAAWVKPSADRSEILVSKYAGLPAHWELGLGASGGDVTGHAFFRVDGSVSLNYFAVDPANIAVGSWSLLCGSFDASTGTLKIYVNGSLKATTTSVSQAGTRNDNVTIGARQFAGAEAYYQGAIDDVRVVAAASSDASAAFTYHNESSSDNEIDYIGEVAVATSRLLVRRRRMCA